MSVTEDLSCILNMSAPSGMFTCLVTISGEPVWNIIFVGILVLAVGGTSLIRPINEGLMIGGFLSSLAGLGLLAAELISVKIWMLALFITITGIIITSIKASKND